MHFAARKSLPIVGSVFHNSQVLNKKLDSAAIRYKLTRMEAPFFFKNGPENMFGVLHTPENQTTDAGILLCHSFGEEKLWSHRISVNLAREVVSRGFAALRFDFRGHGDSAGNSEDCTIDSYLSDIETAIATFRSECPAIRNITLLGLRFGATLASLYANRGTDIRHLILWEPVIQGERYMQELLRINLSTQLAVYGKVQHNREALVEQMRAGSPANVDGYLISNDFYEQSSEIDLLDIDWNNSDVDVLVTQISATNTKKDRVELLRLLDHHTKSSFLRVKAPPFWREIKPFTSRPKRLIGETLDWWEKRIAS